MQYFVPKQSGAKFLVGPEQLVPLSESPNYQRPQLSGRKYLKTIETFKGNGKVIPFSDRAHLSAQTPLAGTNGHLEFLQAL